MPTIKDVAKVSGVSTTTVSFVLNNSRAVSPAARTRVLSAASKLGYMANPLARGLSTGRSYTLGVLMPDLNTTLITQVVIGIEEAARNLGYKIVPVFHNEDLAYALTSLTDLTARRVDGLVSTSWTADQHPEIEQALVSYHLPHVVGFYRAAPDDGVDSIVADHRQGALLATQYLLNRGCRGLAFIGGLEHREATRERLQGFRDAHAERGMPVHEDRILFGDFSISQGVECAQRLLKVPMPADAPPLDGIFAASDHLAAGALRALRAAGRRVPEDVAVFGFDNHLIAEATDPPLSSVEMPLREIGRRCVERLLLRLDHPDEWEPATFALPCSLVLREST